MQVKPAAGGSRVAFRFPEPQGSYRVSEFAAGFLRRSGCREANRASRVKHTKNCLETPSGDAFWQKKGTSHLSMWMRFESAAGSVEEFNPPTR